MTEQGITVCGVGLKGANFVERLLAAGLRPDRVVSYRQADDLSCSFERILELTQKSGITFVEDRSPVVEASELVFIVGWQYLIRQIEGTIIVFHDSVLPRYRGFAPTVTALINGDPAIGVTPSTP